MLEAATAVFVWPSRRLHDPVERQIREYNNFAHKQLPPHEYLNLLVVYMRGPLQNCKKPPCSDRRISRLIMVEVIHLLRNAFGSHARKCFDVANKMRLVIEIEGRGNICQSFKLSGFDESYRLIKTLHPNIQLGGKTHCLGESSFKLAFGYMEVCKQVVYRNRTNVCVDETEAFFD